MARRLQVLPEVLPAPTVTSPDTARPDVRGRTLAHMQRLLATTAAVVPLASCTRSDMQGTQTVTIPMSSASATTQDTSQGSLLPPPTATAVATAIPTATADMGYAVVDPMPAPARCLGLANASKANATFKRDATGLFLEVTLTLPTGSAWAGATFTPGSQPSPWSGQLLSSQVSHLTATARVRPTAGVTSLGISFSISCTAGPGSLSITASFPNSPTDTTKVTLQKNDY